MSNEQTPIDVVPVVRRYARLAKAVEDELRAVGSILADNPSAVQAATATLHIMITERATRWDVACNMGENQNAQAGN